MQEKVHGERSIYRGIIYERSKLDTMKMPRDGRIKRSSLSPGGTVGQPVVVQAQAWLDSLIPALQPRARGQEHLVEQTTKCFQKTALASMALLLKRWCEPNSLFSWWNSSFGLRRPALASTSSHLRKASENLWTQPRSPHWPPSSPCQTSASEFPGNADERLQGPGPRSGCSSRNSGTSFHSLAPHRSAFTPVWFNTMPLTLPQVDLRTNIQKGLCELHETNTDGIISILLS